MTTAKLFMNGRSQAVRLPREFRFSGDQVRVRRFGLGVLLEPAETDPDSWFEALDRLRSLLCPRDASSRQGRPARLQVSYLLDINACVAIIDGRPRAVRERLRDAWRQGRRVSLSSIALLGLWNGVAKSQRVAVNRERLSVFLAKLDGLPFDERDAEVAGGIRAELERQGKPIGAYDTLMAGQALRRGMTLVTANIAEFDRVAGLQWENWAEA